ncbi:MULTISPECIES: hypothetical protein [Roseateles]|uniref:hypothetical protein n=1 Tax=Roseateles TaxID=93681 RepID=UPI000BD8D01F|nr:MULTISPECIES: hypothetical protein [Roseateles]OYU29169.1 MAG: hypothetical protein CFE41_01705 [Burkholderiales bacterium PBB2]
MNHQTRTELDSSASTPVELTLEQLAHVAGGGPKGGWGPLPGAPVVPDAPTPTEAPVPGPKGGW